MISSSTRTFGAAGADTALTAAGACWSACAVLRPRLAGIPDVLATAADVDEPAAADDERVMYDDDDGPATSVAMAARLPRSLCTGESGAAATTDAAAIDADEP